jgi:glycosyltransferase involved in cell wall biosynthesis
MIVSIVTPVLNGGQYLRDCIESVKRETQSGILVEHLIVDGGSTDGSYELAEALGLRVLRRSKLGLIERINLGFRAAEGELIGYLGADDFLLGGAVEAVVEAYRRSGRRWLVGGYRWISADGQSLGDLRAPPRWIPLGAYAALDWPVISELSTYMHKEFFLQLGGYDERYRIATEFDLYARALQQEPFERIARSLACSRRHGQNASEIQKERAIHEVRAIRESLGLGNGFKSSLNRCAMKAWFNLRNPRWCAGKLESSLLSFCGTKI